MSLESALPLRKAGVVGAALAVNVGLFVLMETMVERDRMRLKARPDAVTIDFVRTSIEDQTRTKDRRRKPPPKPQETKKPQARMNVSEQATQLPSPVDALDIKNMLSSAGGIAIGGRLVDGEETALGQTLLEGDLTPISKLPPQYPPNARLRNIEGFVDIEFTVDADGFVQDPIVRRSRPPGVFDRAALSGVSRWRYRPVTADGTAVAVRVLVTVEFYLE